MMNTMEDMYPFHGLRGVCAMAIFLGHQTDMFISRSPFPSQTVPIIGLEYLQAISLFFLLSGIPLTRLYGSTGTNKISTRRGVYDFYYKRVARLIPIYYLTLALNTLVILLCVEQIGFRALLKSLLGCAVFLQSWFVSFIDVGGVLWQVAVFMFGYALFPFVSNRVTNWNTRSLIIGIGTLWLVSLALFLAVFALPPEIREWERWIWHVHCVSRLPHFVAGVLLGEVVERLRASSNRNPTAWSIRTDCISVVLVGTAIQAPIVQVYYGTDTRTAISIAFEAILVPLYALWLAGMVLAYNDEDPSGGSDSSNNRPCCWTRRVLSWKPLVVLGDASLTIYCLHLVVLFCYTMVLAYLTTGNFRLAPTIDNYQLRVQAAWWHAPIQWILVLAVSIAVSKWYEAPLRKLLVARRRNTATTKQANTSSSSDVAAAAQVKNEETVGMLSKNWKVESGSRYGALRSG